MICWETTVLRFHFPSIHFNFRSSRVILGGDKYFPPTPDEVIVKQDGASMSVSRGEEREQEPDDEWEVIPLPGEQEEVSSSTQVAGSDDMD